MAYEIETLIIFPLLWAPRRKETGIMWMDYMDQLLIVFVLQSGSQKSQLVFLWVIIK